MTTEAGSPCLNRHVPRTEIEALRERIDAALKVARTSRRAITPKRLTENEGSCALDALEAVMKIISILDPAQKETV